MSANTSLITENFQVDTAVTLFNELADLNNSNNIYYLCISKVDPWANGESSPDQLLDNKITHNIFWRKMIGGKRILGSDVALVVSRINWVKNTVYSEYESSGPSIYGTNFYVLTTDFNVYKCLDNNANSASTVMPTYTDPTRTNTESDNYTWKYMLTLNTRDRVRFLTSQWMPIRTLLLNDGSLQWQVQQNALPGGIHKIKVLSGGNLFANSNTCTVVINGDGTSAAAIPNVNSTSQTVTSITITSPGSKYNFANASVIPTGNNTGSNATLEVIISPYSGHGSNPVYELGAAGVMINTRLNADEHSTLSANCTYRQLGVVQNPVQFGNTAPESNTTFSQTMYISTSSGAGNYILGEYVFQGNGLSQASFSGRVVDWDPVNNIIQLTELAGSPTAASLVGFTSGTNRFVLSITNQQVQPYSGRVIYFEDFVPIQRSLNQTDDLRVVILT